MGELYSHPDQLLRDHLQGVLHLTRHLLSERRWIGWEKERLEQLATLAAVFHDFGKATKYFQDYICGKEEKQRIPRQLKAHSLISSVIGYHLAKHLLEGEEDPLLLDSFFLLLAIKRHHGNLNDIRYELNDFDDKEQIAVLLKQAEAIDYDAWNAFIAEIKQELPGSVHMFFPLSVERVQTWIREMESEAKRLRRLLRKHRKNFQLEDYFRLCTLFSLLLDADKQQAGLRDKQTQKRPKLGPDWVDRYLAGKVTEVSPINQLRRRAYREVAEKIETIQGRIFTITLPTGMGKTLISFNAALKLRERRRKETGVAPQIIYTLPFLSVIDQNYAVFEELLRQQTAIDHTLLLKHHSLVEAKYRTNQEEEEEFEYRADQAKLLIEGWQSEIVCTTFYQLFHCLLSRSNRFLRRFHRLSHAIILIDEVQSIPVKYWPLMREMLLLLSQQSDIILLTATQPKIFTENDPVIPLVESSIYFKEMNRFTLYSNLNQLMTLEEFADSLTLEEDRSYLFIFNTIASAKQFYQLLRQKTDEPIGFLSTHVPPKERLRRIRKIQQGEYRIVVSTQLVEAGVDISFDVVYRDFCPLDSLIQSAGRCNRHGQASGVVHFVRLIAQKKEKEYAKLIYEPVKLDITQELLAERKKWEEAELLAILDEYFNRLSGRSKSDSDPILQGVKQLYFFGEKQDDRWPITAFRLIEDDAEKIEVFLELDKEAEEVWDQYEEIWMEKDRIARIQKFEQIKGKFRDYLISVPVRVKNVPPVVNGMYYVSQADLSTYYDQETGFITEEVNPIW